MSRLSNNISIATRNILLNYHVINCFALCFSDVVFYGHIENKSNYERNEVTKKCVNLAWNQYGYQWDSLAIDCLIVITRNRFRMCAFLFFFCWSFYLVWWKRNVSRRHICSPVIPFTIHKTHWHTYGNNNIKRPQISRNEFFMLAVRQQHTARCDTHRLDKRIRTSFEHEHEHEHTQTERNNEREREKKSKWKTIHNKSVSALALLLPQLLLLLCDCCCCWWIS